MQLINGEETYKTIEGGKLLKELDLPKLKGTERQIKWGEDIRADFVKDYALYLKYVTGMSEKEKAKIVNEAFKYYGYKGETVEQLIREAFDKEIKNTSAKYWIDSRDITGRVRMHRIEDNYLESL